MYTHSHRRSFTPDDAESTAILSFVPASPEIPQHDRQSSISRRFSLDDSEKETVSAGLFESSTTSSAERSPSPPLPDLPTRRRSSAAVWVASLIRNRLYKSEPESYSSSAWLLGEDERQASLKSRPLKTRLNTILKHPLIRWIMPLLAILFSLIGILSNTHPKAVHRATKAIASIHKPLVDMLRPATPDYLCPVPGEPRNNITFTPSTLSKRFSIPSTHESFDLHIAHSTVACNSFRITISRKSPMACRAAMKHRVTKDDPELQDHITNHLGPDTFQVRIDGAERFVLDTPTAFHHHACSYEFDFHLNAPGAIWLSVLHTFEKYEGFYDLYVDDSASMYPNTRFVVNGPLRLKLCPDHACPAFVAPVFGKPYGVVDLIDPPAPNRALREASDLPTLPACTGGDPIEGTFVPVSIPALLYPYVPLPTGPLGPSGGRYDFVPNGCTFQHDGLRYRNHLSCLVNPHRALFVGDSHARAAGDGVRHRLEGNNSILEHSAKSDLKTYQVGNLAMDVAWDRFLEFPYTCQRSTYDSIIVSTMTHQAAFQCSTPTKDILAKVEETFKTWPKLAKMCRPSHDTTFIFLTTPAFFYADNSDHLECRTGPRLDYWARKSAELARKHGWKVVDVMGLSKPFAIDTRQTDGIHYLKTDAMNPLTDEIIEKMGICGNEGEIFVEY